MMIQSTHKKAAWLVVLMGVFAAPSLLAQTEVIPRLTNGLPDMQGTWDFRTITPFQRPTALGEQDDEGGDTEGGCAYREAKWRACGLEQGVE